MRQIAKIFRKNKPQVIDENLCYLNKLCQSFPAVLEQKTQISDDTFLYRFNFEDQNKYLGIQTGQNVQIEIKCINGHSITRSYSPISAKVTKGYVDFMVKMITKNDNQEYYEMSHALMNLEENDQITIKGPYGNLIYEGNGVFQIKRQNEIQKKFVKYLGIIVENTGLTAYFQIIDQIVSLQDGTFVSILYSNQSLEDPLFLEELCWFQEQNKIKLYLHFEKNYDHIPHVKGELSFEKIEQYIPKPSNESLILICGSKKFRDNINRQLLSNSYTEDMMWIAS